MVIAGAAATRSAKSAALPVYVPGATWIVSLALAASIADWIVLIPPLAVLSTSQVTAEPITTFSMP